MGDRILLFESRDLCYESNRYFMACMEDAFEKKGYPVEVCDLSVRMEEKLENLLGRQERYLAAFDFNSLLPRLELEDKTPYLEAFRVPFYNYLVDHPLYHHAGIRRGFPNYSVICIDACHCAYIRRFYPWISHVFHLPLGGMQAEMERTFDQKRLELLLPGTYEPEEALYEQLLDYPREQRLEISAMIEMMQADAGLTQEGALEKYLKERGEKISDHEFVQRLNRDYLADKYLRNYMRRREAAAVAGTGVPFTIVGYGWDEVPELSRKNVTLLSGVGFAASIQMIADAKMLLNTTPGFHGGLHDRVYSAMLGGTVCLTERSTFAKQKLRDGVDAVLYDSRNFGELANAVTKLTEQPGRIREIAREAKRTAFSRDTWDCRVEKLTEIVENGE